MIIMVMYNSILLLLNFSLFSITVLEASDADNLLEQFEEVSPDFDDDYSQNSSISGHFSTNTTSSNNVQNGSAGNGNSKNPRKTSNIFKAVQNHFAASAASTSTGGGSSGSRDNPTRKLPRIGKHESKFKITCRLFCWSTHGIFVMHADWMDITCRKWNVE